MIRKSKIVIGTKIEDCFIPAEVYFRALRGDDDVLRCCQEITKRENEADEITREVMTALRKTS